MMASNNHLHAWIAGVAEHLRPRAIMVCDGSEAERSHLHREMVASRDVIELDARVHPGSVLYRSRPDDIARTEHLTFICTDQKVDAGPTNNWMDPTQAEQRVWPLFAGAMAGRVMYVVPYVLGPLRSPFARVGVQITDSPYVVLNLGMMTRMGVVALEKLAGGAAFVRGVHSLADLDPERRFIMHFPERQVIWSIGSSHGGNALLSKHCHALRLASVEASRAGWLAEHMLVLGATSPRGEKHYIAAAFPSTCGKTNLAMLAPTLPGWKIETVGDDVCWMHPGSDGRLWAVNPENGIFGVAPGTSERTNPKAMKALATNAIFTNVALRRGSRIWWEGLGSLEHGEVLDDWTGKPWIAGRHATPAAHPNARFTVPLAQCPSLDPNFDAPQGVPISAIVFGTRRARLAPLVYEAMSWRHGVYVGATMRSENTAAATEPVEFVHRDPMAMLPFCGYNMGDYFAHWLRVGRGVRRPPKIFHVNWFRTDTTGRTLWPGFGENVRVLDWIFGRLADRHAARDTAIGGVPHAADLDLAGLDISPQRVDALLTVDPVAWLEEAVQNMDFLRQFGTRLPTAMKVEHHQLVKRLLRATGALEH